MSIVKYDFANQVSRNVKLIREGKTESCQKFYLLILQELEKAKSAIEKGATSYTHTFIVNNQLTLEEARGLVRRMGHENPQMHKYLSVRHEQRDNGQDVLVIRLNIAPLS